MFVYIRVGSASSATESASTERGWTNTSALTALCSSTASVTPATRAPTAASSATRTECASRTTTGHYRATVKTRSLETRTRENTARPKPVHTQPSMVQNLNNTFTILNSKNNVMYYVFHLGICNGAVRGTCVDVECFCSPGWTGANCSIPSCVNGTNGEMCSGW